MTDFAAEGRGGAQDDSALGRYLTGFAKDWHTEAGFERGRPLAAAADELGALHDLLVGAGFGVSGQHPDPA
jgi:hypothetical protein